LKSLLRPTPTARNIPVTTFKEASELAYFGAKVLHPKTIAPAVEKGIPVIVKNTANMDHPGTKIIGAYTNNGKNVKAIALKKGIKLVNIYSLRMLDAYGYLAKIFTIFDRHKIVVDMVSTSEVSVSVTIEGNVDTTKLEKELSEFSTVKVDGSKAIICVVGEGLKSDETIVGKVFNTMSDLKINVEMISQGSSDINLSFVIPEKSAPDAVRQLHKMFFE